jgi:hypothetical protein
MDRRKLFYWSEQNGGGSFYVRNAENITLRELKHYIRHSPTGMSWGYGGSGPADLARSILIDFMGLHSLDDRHDVPPTAMYHEFKFEIIAAVPPEPTFNLSGESVHLWLEAFFRKNGETLWIRELHQRIEA